MFGEYKFAQSLFATSSAVKQWQELCRKATVWTTVDKSVILTSRCA